MGGGGRWILFSSISIFCFRPSLSAHPQILLDGGGGEQGWEREASSFLAAGAILFLFRPWDAKIGMSGLINPLAQLNSLALGLFLAGNKTGKTIQSFPLIVFVISF